MSSVSSASASQPAAATLIKPAVTGHSREASLWRRFPTAAALLTLALLALMFFPPVRTNPRLVWTFLGVAGSLFAWQLALWLIFRRQGRCFAMEFVPVKSHYVQGFVQFCIMVWWGWYWREVYAQGTLILAQLLFVYTLEALLSWSRGRTWRFGFGPMPIVLSTNLLLWFRHDWFYYQFLMLAAGAFAKQFITWTRDGKRTHIFNPSAFGQFLFAVVLIATGTTNHYTLGREIAATFEAPHILIVIFLGGLLVQYLFHVTLMTVAAFTSILLFNLIYTEVTGVYWFVNTNVAAPIFLGLHLLITDPATSPRTNLGRVLFGAVYGLAYTVLFHLLDYHEVPHFWDKLLPVPILNLCVPFINRMTQSGRLGQWNRAWENCLHPRLLNPIHMACWTGLLSVLWATGYVGGPHEGSSVLFWKKAYAAGKPLAGHSLVLAAGSQAEGAGSPEAYNELGLICMEGKIVRENHGTAARYFSQACELGDLHGCVNVALQYLQFGERRSDEDLSRALDRLEQDCRTQPHWETCYVAGLAYESGRGRPWSKDVADALYERCGANLLAGKGRARIALTSATEPGALEPVAAVLEQGCAGGDADSCWYMAHLHHGGKLGAARDEAKARSFFERACELGAPAACNALKLPKPPPLTNPSVSLPAWASAFPVP